MSQTHSQFDSIIVGWLAGILVPALCLVMFYYTSFTKVSIDFFIQRSLQIEILPKLLSLCVIPNLGVFFLFLWRDHYRSARGVILATFMLTIGILGLKIFF